MKHVLPLVPMLAALYFVVLAGAETTICRQRATAAPPLELSPELLEEGLPAATKKEQLPVDNSACYVCHGNYETESLALTHGRKEIGCVSCHGESIDHRNDEDNITPPDTMYDVAGIDTMCKKCHESHDVPAREVVKRWHERRPKTVDVKQLACTDCHFEHRLPFRNVRWNKKTRELVAREKAPQSAPADRTD